MPLGEPFLPKEPEWLIRASAGLPPIQKTSELPERLKDCKNCHLPCTQTGKEIPFYGKCPEFRFGKQTPSEGDLVVRESVKRFAVLMETKLRKNDYKSHWSKESFTYLFGRLDEEMKELQAVSSVKTDYKRITDEAIDVANFLMMIVDNMEKLREGKDGE